MTDEAGGTRPENREVGKKGGVEGAAITKMYRYTRKYRKIDRSKHTAGYLVHAYREVLYGRPGRTGAPRRFA